MGWEDRDYNQTWSEYEPAVSAARVPPGALTLMILHGLGFVLSVMMQHDAGVSLGEQMQIDAAHLNPLAILFHPFVASGGMGWAFVGLLLTLYILWKFVGPLELQLGWRRMIGLYAAGSVLCGGLYYAAAVVAPPLATKPLFGPVGAMAAWAGLIVRQGGFDGVLILGHWWTAGRITVVVLALVALLNIVGYGVGALAWLVIVLLMVLLPPALDGAASLMRGLRSPEATVRRAARRTPSRPKARPQPAAEPESPDASEDIDDLLAKISRSGLASLTPEERERLERARSARLRAARR